MDKTKAAVAALLDRLADGETVVLGAFGDNSSSGGTDADEEAALLREVADSLREE